VEDHLFPESRSRLVDAGFALIEMGSGFQVLGEALAGGVTPLGLVKIRDGAKVRGMFGLAESHPPVAAGGDLAGLDQLLGQWEQRRLQGEDVSEAVAERITPDELNALPGALIQRVDRLLFGTNGKGGAAPAVAVAEAAQPKPGAEAGEVAQVIRTLLAEVLHLTEIDDERSFMDYGLDSIAGMQLAVRLEKRLKKEVSPQSLIGFPTVAELAKHLVP
jgi:acyl carrier protein